MRCLVILAAEDDAEFEQAGKRQRRPGRTCALRSASIRTRRTSFADDPERPPRLTASRLDRHSAARARSARLASTTTTTSRRATSSRRCSARSLRLARDRGLPVVIHTREAEDDTLRLIDEESSGQPALACSTAFPATLPQAARALATGFHLSIPGIATFPKADRPCAMPRGRCPTDRLLIETDSPYLAPVPFRGKRNEPAYVVKVLDTLAELRGVDRDALGTQLVENFDRALRRTKPCAGGHFVDEALPRLRVRKAQHPHELAHLRALTLRRGAMVRLTSLTNAASKARVDLVQMFEPVRADLDAVEREFERQVQSKVGVIPEIGSYIQKSGGKRVRPAVLLMAARLCGYSGPRAILNAAVVEFIHTATLVHDDIIDDAECGAGRRRCTRAGATTSPCSPATSSTSSRWRWR